MGIILSDEIKALFEDPQSRIVLATTDTEGVPHVVFKGSVRVNKDNYLEYKEFIESSQTNKNMVASIWFHKKVAINIFNQGRSFQIKGTPYRAIIAGQYFEEVYKQVQEQRGNVDLSTIWLIEPEEIREESFEYRRVTEEEAHPLLKHLDRLVVSDT